MNGAALLTPGDPPLDRTPPSPIELGVRRPWQQIAAAVAVATILAWASAFWLRGLPIAYSGSALRSASRLGVCLYD